MPIKNKALDIYYHTYHRNPWNYMGSAKAANRIATADGTQHEERLKTQIAQVRLDNAQKQYNKSLSAHQMQLAWADALDEVDNDEELQRLTEVLQEAGEKLNKMWQERMQLKDNKEQALMKMRRQGRKTK